MKKNPHNDDFEKLTICYKCDQIEHDLQNNLIFKFKK